ncbi:Uncharacterized protein BM_BM5726 [Brugia malayi]|uniref:Protein kinase domain-containing protein n=1 Tax=Brugia malayi TaxID=6279 RepID=A0A4E9F8D0_BRUMA|nr:Uncharacterized protein BM_BM5726 [Brugia malayi]VIO91206.1 Uncharacterized protein BM_BM5726 [Brugia malayi]
MKIFNEENESKLVQFPNGKIVGARWLVRRILGTGAYGAVYEVQSVTNPLISGALKAESNSATDSILKLEVEVLKQLQSRKYTVRLLYSGKRETYSYMVMTLCGPDLLTVKNMKNLVTFSESTTLRIAVLSLYAIKQVLLRGTLRYCSVNTHKRNEQGRVDDLWSLMYMLIELRCNYLPWSKATREDRILYLKESIPDKQLLSNGKMEFYERILAHLRKLRYPDRPDYHYMYKLMVSPMIRKRYLFNEPYDWEVVSEGATQEESESMKKSSTSSPKSVSPIDVKPFNSIIPEDIPVAQEHAFDEGENDVPDIMKTSYHVYHRRQDRGQRASQDENNVPNEDLP